MTMRWAEPAWLFLLLFASLPFLRERARPRLRWPSLVGFREAPRAWAGIGRHLRPLLRGGALASIAVALARPQTVGGQIHIAARGVAIVVVLDRSTSMTAQDFPEGDRPLSRLEAARRTFERFVAGRPDDLIGLIAFANYPDRLSPPTLDHRHLLEAARSIRPAQPGEDGTNLGHAVVLAAADLKAAAPKQKVLIFLTDGQDRPAVPNPIDPRKAAALARDLGIRLYTIAVGREGGLVRGREQETDLPVVGTVEGPNFPLLAEMAAIGGGRAYVASDARGLSDVFQRIDALEKSPVRGTIRTRYHEEFGPWAAAGVVLLVLDGFLSSGRLRRIP
jgi:Ca-activated chloride channel family protein